MILGNVGCCCEPEDVCVPFAPCRPCAWPKRDLQIHYEYVSTVDGTTQATTPIPLPWNGTGFNVLGKLQAPADSPQHFSSGCFWYTIGGLACGNVGGQISATMLYRTFSTSAPGTGDACGAQITLGGINTTDVGTFTCSPLRLQFWVGSGALTSIFVITDPLNETFPDSDVTFLVKGCFGLPLPGATVTLTPAGTPITQVTDSNGLATFTNLPAKTYSYTASKTNFLSPAALILANEGCTDPPVTTIQLNGSGTANYRCACTECVEPQKRLLTLTDANGAHTMTWSASDAAWFTCYSLGGQTIYSVSPCGTSPTTGNVTIGYKLQCTAGGSSPFRLTQRWSACTSGATKFPAAGVCLGGTAGLAQTSGGLFASSSTVTPTGMTMPADCAAVLDLDATISDGYANGPVTITE